MASYLTATGGLSTAAIIASTAAATIAALSLLRLALYPRHPQTLRSPLRTVIPSLTPAELDALDYKPDAFPGARDVATPYGSVRVYEFGPASGQKVLLLHGISTSCQTLTRVARLLAEGRSGTGTGTGRCRVMLFDLFGRGFSDSPSDVPHDARLYVSQALMAMASSPLAWTGEGARVRVVGYSMGGGIATHLVASFPGLVESLVLLAPAGLIRPDRFGTVANAVFRGGWVPERVLGFLTRRRLQRPIASGVKGGEKEGKGGGEEELLMGSEGHGLVGAALAEAGGDGEDGGHPTDGLELGVLRYVQWMVRHHEGFIPAFMASLRDAPLMGQHEAYRRLARDTDVPVAMLFGRKDTVVDEQGYREDALKMMGGEERVKWKVVDGGHDFPMTHAKETVRIMEEFWAGIQA